MGSHITLDERNCFTITIVDSQLLLYANLNSIYAEKQMYHLVFSSLDRAFLTHPSEEFHGKCAGKKTTSLLQTGAIKCTVIAVSSVLQESCQQNISEGAPRKMQHCDMPRPEEWAGPSSFPGQWLLGTQLPQHRAAGGATSHLLLVGDAPPLCKGKREIPPQMAVLTPPHKSTARLGFPKEFRAVRHPNPTKISLEKSQLELLVTSCSSSLFF